VKQRSDWHGKGLKEEQPERVGNNLNAS
jgi:hypothetical protein